MLGRLNSSRTQTKTYLKPPPRFFKQNQRRAHENDLQTPLITSARELEKRENAHTVLRSLLPSLHKSWMRRPLENRDVIIHMAIDKKLKGDKKDEDKSPSSSPNVLFEKVMSSLLFMQQAELASSVFQRFLKKGYQLSNRMVLQLVAPGLNDADDHTKLHLMRLVQDESYTEKDLISFLRLSSRYNIQEDVLASIVDAFRLSRGPGYRLSSQYLKIYVSSAARLGKIDDAFQILEDYPQPTTLKPVFQRGLFNAYMGLLATLRETYNWNDSLCTKVLQILSARGRWLSTRVFDELIAGELSVGNGETALFMFSMLREMEGQKRARPSVYTFDMMMSLYKDTDPKILNTYSQAKSGAHIPLRLLFQYFYRSFQNSKHQIFTSSHLNLALRAFMAHRDYSGALTVFDAFVERGVKVDHKTYSTVLKALMMRTSQDVSIRRVVGSSRWGDRFLGIDFKNTWPKPDVNVELAKHFMYRITRKKFDLEAGLYPVHGPGWLNLREIGEDHISQFNVPRIEDMREPLLPPSMRTYYDPTPLRRLLSRALLANDPGMGALGVYEAMETAREEMLLIKNDRKTALRERTETTRGEEGQSTWKFATNQLEAKKETVLRYFREYLRAPAQLDRTGELETAKGRKLRTLNRYTVQLGI